MFAQSPGVEQHRALAHMLEGVCDRVILNRATMCQHVLQQFSELGNVPLAIAELVKPFPDRVCGRDREAVAKRTVHAFDAQLTVQPPAVRAACR